MRTTRGYRLVLTGRVVHINIVQYSTKFFAKNHDVADSIPVRIAVAVAGAVEAVAVVGQTAAASAPSPAPSHPAHHGVLHRHSLDVCS